MLSGLVPHVQKAKYLLGSHSSTILTGVGVGGTVATAYLTGRATFKAARLISEQQNVMDEVPEDGNDHPINEHELTRFDKVKLTWRLYIPPVGAGVITIGSIIAANRISAKKVAALVVASGVSERALSEYKEKVLEKLGPRKSQDVQDEIAQDRVANTPLPTREIVLAGTGDVLCFDITTGRYFANTMEGVKRAENEVNREIIHFMSCSLSKFYDEIGLPPTPYSDTVGWNLNNHMEVVFSTVLSPDGRPCMAIDFTKAPVADYDNVWT